MSFSACLKKFRKALDEGLKFLAVFIIGFYRIIIKGLLGGGGGCRFYPSCGDYALQAYEKHPFFEATQRTVRRLLSCHPFSFADISHGESERKARIDLLHHRNKGNFK